MWIVTYLAHTGIYSMKVGAVTKIYTSQNK